MATPSSSTERRRQATQNFRSTEKDSLIMEEFMKEALHEAKKAAGKGEVPIGAVITHQGKIIARGHNNVEASKDATQHAEMIALKKAYKKLDAWRLTDCELYVTMEPCPMCMGAINLSRIKNVYFGTSDEKAGACGSVIDIPACESLNHRVKVFKGMMEEESKELLQDFFAGLRKRNKKRKEDQREKQEV